MPPLDALYVETGDDTKIIETKWQLLGWIMSLSEDVISAIKHIPKDFLIISTILYALVKVLNMTLFVELYKLLIYLLNVLFF